MKTRYFYSMSEYENTKSYSDFDIADFVIENNILCVDFTTECKKAKTAVKRLFKAINNSKYNELFDGWEESIIESMENGIYRQYEENEFAWSVSGFDDVFYIYIKFFNYEPTKNDTTYTVTRFYFPHGIEGESMETSVKEFDTLEKAIKHAHRYAKGIRFAGVWIENQKSELVYEILSNSEVIDHTTKEEKMVKELNMAVCEGRHDILQATDGAIFEETIPKNIITDVEALEVNAFYGLWEVCHKKGFTNKRTDKIVAGVKLNLYVTGLTVTVISAIKAAKKHGINVTLWHYDRDNNNYYPQEI